MNPRSSSWKSLARGVALGGALLMMAAQSVGAPTADLFGIPFTSLVGPVNAQGRPVLLRWYTFPEVLNTETAVVFKTGPGFPRSKVAVVGKTRDAGTILGLYAQPANAKARQEMNAVIDRLFGAGQSADATFPGRLAAILDMTLGDDGDQMRRNVVVQQNHVAAMVEGLAWMDTVPDGSGPWEYELWAGDSAGTPQQALGKITVLANAATQLPAPIEATEVRLKPYAGAPDGTYSSAGHQRIFLNWETPPSYLAVRPVLAGFDVYRLPRALGASESFESVAGELQRVNRYPILPAAPAGQAGDIPENAYQFADWGEALEGGDLLPLGQQFTYWVVARDAFANSGLPSDPVEAASRDLLPPQAPKGVSATRQTNPDTGAPFIRLSWISNAEDTVAYRVYRHQLYANVGKPGLQGQVSGITEGEIASAVTHPGPGVAVAYDDASIPAQPLSYWFSVSAVDEAGNEGPASAPLAVSIDDFAGPSLDPELISLCTASPTIDTSVTTALAPNPLGYWTIELKVQGTTPGFSRVALVRIDPNTNEETELPDVPLEGTRLETTGDALPGVTEPGDVPRYKVRFFDVYGIASNELTVLRPSGWDASQKVVVTATASRTESTEHCGILSGAPRLAPKEPGGRFAPVMFSVMESEPMESVVLYRSLDQGVTYQLVDEFPKLVNSFAPVDAYQPESGQATALYMLQGKDTNGSLGSPVYLSAPVHFAGPVNPLQVAALSHAGSTGAPQMKLELTGDPTGLSHLSVSFSIPGSAQAADPIIVPVSALAYNPATDKYEVLVASTDSTGQPISATDGYKVTVASVAESGVTALTPAKEFLWAQSFQADGGTLLWPRRGLPADVPAPDAAIRFRAEEGDVLLRLTQNPFPVGGNPTLNAPALPFMVWRRRTDSGSGADQPWLMVSPRIDSLRTVNNLGLVTVSDPFFVAADLEPDDGLHLYYRDSDGLVAGASYEYMVLTLRPEDYELLTVWGPYTLSLPGL